MKLIPIFEDKKFKDKWEKAEFYLDDVENLSHEIEGKYEGDLKVSYEEGSESIILSYIGAPEGKQKQGIGTSMMKELCAYADKNHLPIKLHANGDLGTEIKALKKFYAGFGFKDRNVVVSKTKTGKYFASLTYDTGIKVPVPVPMFNSVGIDLGIKHFIVLSSGEKVPNHKFLKSSQERLAVLQRRQSKKTKGSNRRKAQVLKIAKAHEKVVNQRKDFQHKLSTSIVNKYDTVCMENLAVANMVKNHSLAEAISDAAWSQFVGMVKYKCVWYGKNFLQIGRFEPSSKMCTCGVINRELILTDREWTCSDCGVTHDRDILAANNIKNFALRNAGQGLPKEDVELPTLVGARKRQVAI